MVLLLALIPQTLGQGEVELEIALDSTVTLHELGLITINETFTVSNPTSSPVEMPTLHLLMPSEYFGKITATNIDGPVEMILTITNSSRGTILSAFHMSQLSLPPNGESQIITIGFAVEGAVEPFPLDFYRFIVPILPTVDGIMLNEVRSTIVVPATLTFGNVTDGMEIGGSGLSITISGTFGNVSSSEQRNEFVHLVEQPAAGVFTLVDFEDASRTVVVSPNGLISVREEFSMKNVGFGTLTELNTIPIDDSVIRVTVGATSDPPLKNPTRLFLISNRLDLQRAFSSVLRPGEKILVIYEYNLDRDFLESTFGSVKVSVTPSPPVDSLMGSFKVGIELPFAFRLIDGPNSVDIDGTEQLFGTDIIYEFRPGIIWASGTAFPIGTGIFLILLLGFFLSQRADVKAEREIVLKINKLAEIYQDKISIVGSIVSNFKRLEVGKMERRQVENVRGEMNSIRSKTSSRVSELRKAIIELDPKVGSSFAELSTQDQSYDRAVSQFIQTYDLQIQRKIKSEVFRTKTTDLDKQINKRASNIVNLVHSIVKQVEMT
ncbi:MAG: hypothetical protein V3T99_02025, partial [Nitrososphaerales archaeon]